MTQPAIHVDPAALRAAARAFDGEASHVASLVTQFSGQARLVDQAFGLLTSAKSVESQYHEAVTSALTGLGHLQRALEDAARKLRTGADNYEVADRPIGGSP